MNRKQFLGSAALISALAFGKKSSAAKSRERRRNYVSERIEYKKKLYELAIDCNYDELLDDNFSYTLKLVHYEYKNTAAKKEDFSGSGDSSFKRKGKTKITKAGKLLEFQTQQVAKNLPEGFYPELLRLLHSEDGQTLSFELASGKTILLKNDQPADDLDCFLTTACIRAKQLPDDCTELTALRNFRDTALIATSEGKNLVKKYYNIAPQIVQEINTYSNSSEIWTLLYDELVQGTVNLLDNNKAADAVNLYSSYVNLLEENVLAKN